MTPDNIDNIVNMISENAMWVAGGVIAIGCVGFNCVKDMVVGRSRERTRREIAAYVAEGSMTPEQGERLMRAGKDED